jgi:hypothetical protein
MTETFRQKIYRYWLYCGPGMKGLRRALRINDQVLPIRATIRDSKFYGKNAVAAAHAVEELRDQCVEAESGFIREYPRKIGANIQGDGGKALHVVVEPVLKSTSYAIAEGVDEDALRKAARDADAAADRKLWQTPDSELNEAEIHTKYDGPSGR